MLGSITCPGCSATISTNPWTPPTVTCPRCLMNVDNPFVDRSQAVPLRAIPVERDVSRDQRTGTLLVITSAAIILAGCILMLARLQAGLMPMALVLIMILGGAVGVAWLGFRGGPTPRARTNPPPLPRQVQYQSNVQGPPPVPLQYRAPAGGGIKLGMFFAGFFPGLIVCAMGLLLLAATVDYRPKETHLLFLLIAFAMVVAAAIVSVKLSRRPGWNGFGAGSATGLGVGLMALGPCAACYLFTLN